MRTILIVEDEVAISTVLKLYLEQAGFQVIQAFDGESAIHKFDEDQPDLVLLDVMLPNVDGWTILKSIREKSACPIIMLTALGDANHRLEGLNEGADDYITKPFVSEEVVARVKAVLRRSPNLVEEQQYVTIGNLKLNIQSQQAFLYGAEVNMYPRDFALLLYLVQHPNQTFTREQLLDQVWGFDYDGSDRAVDVAIKRIRQLLSNWPAEEGEIKTIRGLGYQFCVEQ